MHMRKAYKTVAGMIDGVFVIQCVNVKSQFGFSTLRPRPRYTLATLFNWLHQISKKE